MSSSTAYSTLARRTLYAMPLYEYRCNDCDAVFELLRPMALRELKAVCPACESVASMPLISRVAVHAGSSSAMDAAPRSAPGGGGCCGGGGCACGN